MEKKELIKNSDSYGFFQKIKNNKIIIIALIIAIAIIAILVLNFIIRKKLEERRNSSQYIKYNFKQIKIQLEDFLKEICTKINTDFKNLINDIVQGGKKLYIEKSSNNSNLCIRITDSKGTTFINEISEFGNTLGRLYFHYKEITQNIENIEKNKIWLHNNNSDCDKYKKYLDSIFDNIVIKDTKVVGESECHSIKSLFLPSEAEFLNKISNLGLFSCHYIKKEEIKQGMRCSKFILKSFETLENSGRKYI